MRIITLSVLHICSFAIVAATMQSARGELIVAGETLIFGNAVQDITLFAGTPFNESGSDFTIQDVSGTGFLLIDRDTQVGNTINIPSLTGVFTGSNASLGNYRFGTLSTAGEAAFSGGITNVVQDENDPGFAFGDPSSFASGDYQVSGDFFEFELLDSSGTMFTTGAVTFNSQFDGLPPSAGTIINGGDAQVDILFNGDVIGYTSNRRIFVTAVPEPSATALLCGATVLLTSYSKFRNRSGRVSKGKASTPKDSAALTIG